LPSDEPKRLISASRRTDLPSTYGRWFQNRLEAGFCKTVNPFNRKQVSTVSLRPEHVAGFVFWTKELAPFLPQLDQVSARGWPFVVQYTINDAPRLIEPNTPPLEHTLETLARVFPGSDPPQGSPLRRLVWRYDPILLTDVTPVAFHLANFERLAQRLRPFTDEVTVSFAQLYAKTRRRLNEAQEQGLHWVDPGDSEKRALLDELARVACANGLRLHVCCQPELLTDGVRAASCLQAARLGLDSPGVAPTRQGCQCEFAKDIGAYDTCVRGCLYCYAVGSQKRAEQRLKAHDPTSPFLFQ